MYRVKVCGITTVEDALHVAFSGADAIGLVFYKKSPRNVTIDKAIEICEALPPFVSVVALFMNASTDYVHEVVSDVPCNLLQFHGDESAEFCASFSYPYIKAVPMMHDDDFSFEDYADRYVDASGFLVDSHAPGQAGGSGEVFDWQNVPVDYPKPIVLAGGLNPDNVASALKAVDVYAVDVSSGVESEPGIKDPTKVEQFIQEVQSV